MSERIINIEDVSLLDLFGVHEANLEFIRRIFPTIKIISRGNDLKIIGEPDVLIKFEKRFSLLMLQLEKFGKITENDISQIMIDDIPVVSEKSISEDLILHGRNGKLIRPQTANQRKMVKSILKDDLMFAIGPAGSGKTYTAVALAVKALKEKSVRRIILTRPAVEAGENLGFLPGDMKEKLDPYLQPLYDALRDMLPTQKLLTYLEDNTIEIAPLAYMRGRTLDNAFVILDEAQNCTDGQLKMFLTRMGKNAKFIVTGDISQIDLPRNQKSGLVHAHRRLGDIKGISFIQLDVKDIVRHKLVGKIIEAYGKFEE
ncbi:MAG: PhoH family protein [Hyphomicrobiales bacterium]